MMKVPILKTFLPAFSFMKRCLHFFFSCINYLSLYNLLTHVGILLINKVTTLRGSPFFFAFLLSPCRLKGPDSEGKLISHADCPVVGEVTFTCSL